MSAALSRVEVRCEHGFLNGTGFCPDACDKGGDGRTKWKSKVTLRCRRCLRMRPNADIDKVNRRWVCLDRANCVPIERTEVYRHDEGPQRESLRSSRTYSEWAIVDGAGQVLSELQACSEKDALTRYAKRNGYFSGKALQDHNPEKGYSAVCLGNSKRPDAEDASPSSAI